MDRRKRVCVYYTYVDRRMAENDARISSKQMSNIGGRLLHYAVSRLYRIGADELSRKSGEHGKPYFCDHPEIRFNISHSGDIIMCAVSDFEVGVDVQLREVRSIDLVARKIFSPDEYEKYLESPDREELFFRRWVMVESYLKWTGEGITRELNGIYLDGWHQFIHVDRNYAACVWAERPLEVVTVMVRPDYLGPL
jgi:4'-phosphopantetheinyl transferase